MEAGETFFVKDREFYRRWLSLMVYIALQNLIAYSVNMADNIMLGSYSQMALSGAAIVNQIFFVVQFFSNALGEGVVVIGSQYWGRGQVSPVRQCVGIALKAGAAVSLLVLFLCGFQGDWLLMLFTTNQAILAEAGKYLQILLGSFPVFIFCTILYAGLRTVELVRIAFINSILSLVINIVCNYLFIYGNLGAPELGIRGAAIGTVIARVAELAIVAVYCWRDRKLGLFTENLFRRNPFLERTYLRVDGPIVGAQILWALSTPIQTAVLGHLSSDAIAANSVATTFYQYLKVVVQAMCASASVTIGRAVGSGSMQRIREEGRSLSVIFVVIGILLGGLLFALRGPLLSLYELNDNAMELADQLIVVMSFVMVGMSYQMPVSSGIIRGGGDTRYGFITNLVSTWCIVMPLSFLGAFVWKLPVVQVVILLQSDQVFKAIPAFFWYRSYRWVKRIGGKSEKSKSDSR
jgi:putative MATE family efflux protein